MSEMTDEKKPADSGVDVEDFTDSQSSPEHDKQHEKADAEGGDTAALQPAATKDTVEVATDAANGRPNMVDLDSMKDSVFFLFEDRNQRLSKFWILIILSSIIATVGVAGDSAATVIGAMIVAPLMTPILGTMLSTVLTDGPNFILSITLVITGAGCAIFIGYVLGLALSDDVLSPENNSQMASRIEPKLLDLIGALATGAVGSIALVRKDIAGTMPGVAIAIALVPPLCVAGLSLSIERGHDAAGAVLLFVTNFASITVVGVIVMYIYRVHEQARRERARWRGTAVLVLFLLLAFVTIPLTFTSMRMQKIREIQDCLTDKVNEWGEPFGWTAKIVVAREKGNTFDASVTIVGVPPFPDLEDMPNRTSICDADSISVSFSPEKSYEL